MMGPTMMPMLAATAQANISHILSSVEYMSSMLPATTEVGMPDNKPVANLPMTTAIIEGTAATTTEKAAYSAVDNM
jgi:hypothetical protein